MHVCMCTMYMPGGCRGQGRVLDYLKMEYRSLVPQLCILNQNANEESCLVETHSKPGPAFLPSKSELEE